MSEAATFSLWTELKLENRAVIHVDGELDIARAPELRESIRLSLASGARHLVIDLTEATFIDSTALGVIVGGMNRARSLGGSLDIVCPGERVRRTFELTGLLRVIDEYQTVEQALGCLDGRGSGPSA